VILTRTPFRIPLGGGSTDLPAYYEQHGGFIFAVTINLYMYIGLNRPPMDDLIRVKYHESETVASPDELRHNLVRGALKRTGFDKMIEITSQADVPDGTGMGSSASYLVGLLNALHVLKELNTSRKQLAEMAFEIATKDLGLPDGKQDFYAAAMGNFSVLEIESDGTTRASLGHVTSDTQRDFENNCLLFYTGVRRSSSELLKEQQTKLKDNETKALALKHEIKRIGRAVLAAFESGDLETFGRLMDEHWRVKRDMSQKMSNSAFDDVYEKVKQAGALGGKILGAGGGGFFLVYAQPDAQKKVRAEFESVGMREMPFKVDAGGTHVIINHSRERNTI
jgi:D-glycero-alpha-D-manno-heptose-7-phosphate kinase